MKRKTALEIIKIEVAKTGVIGSESMRAFTECNMSIQSLKEAAKKGYTIYKRINK